VHFINQLPKFTLHKRLSTAMQFRQFQKHVDCRSLVGRRTLPYKSKKYWVTFEISMNYLSGSLHFVSIMLAYNLVKTCKHVIQKADHIMRRCLAEKATKID
jgi:hypothetical protein